MVNTAGCGPVMRGFDPHRPPHIKVSNWRMPVFLYIDEIYKKMIDNCFKICKIIEVTWIK